MKAALSLSCFLMISEASAQKAAPLPNTPEAFGVVLREFAQANGLTKAVVVVRRKGAIVFKAGYGGGDPDAPYHLASLSKSITAACIATFIRDGKLALDTKLAVAAPKLLAGAGDIKDKRVLDITVAQLITHRSGLAGNRGDGEVSSGEAQVRTIGNEGIGANVQRSLARQAVRAGLKRAPGSFQYSNDNYAILGAIVQDVDGRSYQDACHERVFKPIGVEARLAKDWQFMGPYGGWSMSGTNYLTFLSAFTGSPTIAGAPTLAWHKQGAGVPPNANGSWYGLGLESRKYANDNNNWHGGSWKTWHFQGPNRSRVDANFRTYAAQIGFDDTSFFVQFEPNMPDDVVQKLDAELWRAFRAVHRW